MKIGFGYDSHRLVSGRKLVLGGREIPYDKGLLGHSDADVLVHAICDAILGATGEGDIGRHFSDTDHTYKNISSIKLLQRVGQMTDKKGYSVNNIDSTIVLEAPKLAEYKDEMATNIAEALHILPDRVNIKAKTNEGMGFVGRKEGMAAFAVVTVEEKIA
ncbi:MAG TPA: 2-C-methyl-D-erythritol 2,4-cyclodiphosphate synthase [Syntrophales bacterium]|nr:2-C-methyl-D-erythritol 2,4-cyclodiphosphate synthase [Syntrophales bacterium]